MTKIAAQGPTRWAHLHPRLNTLIPYALLILTMLFWSGNWVLGRAMHETIPPVGINFWRWVVAVAVMTPIAWPAMRGKWPIARRHWRYFFMLGLTGAALFQTMVYLGLHFTTAINGLLLNSTAPISMIVVSWLMLREGVSRRQWIGVSVSFLGVIVIVARGDLALLLDLRLNIGDLILIVGMPLWAVYSALLRRRPAEIGDIALLWLVGLFGLLPLSLLYLGENLIGRHVPLTWQAVATFVYMGTFASVLAILCWNRAVAMVGPNKSGFFLHLLPAFGTIMAVLALGETVHLFQLAGISLIFLGISLSASARARQPA